MATIEGGSSGENKEVMPGEPESIMGRKRVAEDGNDQLNLELKKGQAANC